VNSYEQLCINIANEQMQTFYNQHVFNTEMVSICLIIIIIISSSSSSSISSSRSSSSSSDSMLPQFT